MILAIFPISKTRAILLALISLLILSVQQCPIVFPSTGDPDPIDTIPPMPTETVTSSPGQSQLPSASPTLCLSGSISEDCSTPGPELTASPEQTASQGETCSMVGSVIFTELMINPSPSSDSQCEYIELYNRSPYELDLSGWSIEDFGSDQFTIPPNTFIPGKEYLLLVRSDNCAIEGQSTLFFGSDMQLANGQDEVRLIALDETTGQHCIVDEFAWDSEGELYCSVPEGQSLSLSLEHYDSAANDLCTSWCASSAELNTGEFGSPGLVNEPCFEEEQCQFQIDVLDVGQGEAVLIRTEDCRAALIDGGEDQWRIGDTEVEPREWLRRHGVQGLDFILATHFHSDHIGGLVPLAQDASFVDQCLDRGDEPLCETKVCESYREACEGRRRLPQVGEFISLGEHVRLQVVSVNGNGLPMGSDENARSISVVIHYKGCSTFVGGDLTSEVEVALVPSLEPVDALVVNHHGSCTSSDPTFIAALSPKACMISTGSNSYGHPEADVLERLQAVGCDTYVTERPEQFDACASCEACASPGEASCECLGDPGIVFWPEQAGPIGDISISYLEDQKLRIHQAGVSLDYLCGDSDRSRY